MPPLADASCAPHVRVSHHASPSEVNDATIQRSNKPLGQATFLALASIVAGVSTLLANWIVANFGVSSRIVGAAAFCAAWIALYPWARCCRKAPTWTHWARGAFILAVLWLTMLSSP
jgi:hypothetical protein